MAGDVDVLVDGLRRAVRAADDAGHQPTVVPLVVESSLVDALKADLCGSSDAGDRQLADECSYRHKVIRRPRLRDLSEVIARQYPERRIVAPEVWDKVCERAAPVCARYKGKRTGTARGNRTHYPLSGLLFCGVCGAAMIIASGTSASYYSCGDARKRGTCSNRTMLREDVARANIFRGVRDALFTPEAVAFLRKRIAERLREVVRSGDSELNERVERHRRTEDRIHGLVKFIAGGDESKYVRETLRDLEAQARCDSAAIGELKQSLSAPVSLPTPATLLERAHDLDRVLSAGPLRAREALRTVFEGGRIAVHPQPDGSYVAEGTFLPLVAMASVRTTEGNHTRGAAVTVPLRVAVPKPLDRRKKRNCA